MQSVWVQAPVRELRSHMPQGQKNKIVCLGCHLHNAKCLTKKEIIIIEYIE